MSRMKDAPQRGADVVNNELEVGFDAAFEGRWRKTELAGRVVMVLVVAAALAGLLGQGPFSHHTARTPDRLLSVDYEPVTHFGTGTQVTLHLSSAAASGGTSGASPATVPVRVSVNTDIVEPMGLQDVVPQPSRSRTEHAAVDWTFDLPAGERDALVRLMVKPAATGPIHLWARLEGGEAVTWTQVVLP